MESTQKKWIVVDNNQRIAAAIAAEISIHPMTAKLLVNRGVRSADEAHRFLHPSLKHLHSPFEMPQMDRCVSRIIDGIAAGELFLIYGDYDVDGITAVSLLAHFLRRLGAKVIYRLPDRILDGYGLHEKYIREARSRGVSVIITADCGISNGKEVALAQGWGIDVIITDHHEISGPLPDAFAILNPKLPRSPFPFRDLAGVGVAFHLVMALRRRLRERGFWHGKKEPNIKQYLDLVALGTIADVVPLLDENRVFAKFGLAELTGSSRIGIKALKEVAGLVNRVINAQTVAFGLAPRLNACGRLSSPESGLRLLLEEDPEEAARLAEELEEHNRKRRQIEDEILKSSLERISAFEEPERLSAIVLASERWHPGVIGIVASKLVERLCRPTVLIAIEGERGRGSARGTEGIDLYGALKECGRFLGRFGGHRLAAGLEIRKDHIEEFSKAFESIVRRKVEKEDIVPRLSLDAEIELRELNAALLEEISLLAPFGTGNPAPLLGARGLGVVDQRVVGNGHLKVKVVQGGKRFDSIGFGMGDRYPLPADRSIALAFIPIMRQWEGSRQIELKIRDIALLDD